MVADQCSLEYRRIGIGREARRAVVVRCPVFARFSLVGGYHCLDVGIIVIPLGLVGIQGAGWNVDLAAPGVIIECVVAVGGQTGSVDIDFSQFAAVAEGIAADAGHAGGEDDFGQLTTVLECFKC